MKTLEKLSRYIELISEWSGRIPAYLIYPGMLIVVVGVMMRYGFSAPTIWTSAIPQRIFAIYFVIGAAYVFRYDGHVRMDVIYNRWSKRTRAIIDMLIMFPCVLAVIFVLIWHGGEFAWQSVAGLEVCGTPARAPVWPAKIFIPIVGILLLLQTIAWFYRNIKIATGRDST